MSDDYLEGLKETWVASNKVAVELGQIESFSIFRSQLQQSGDVNLFLVTKFADSSQLEPNKEEYAKFMKAWGEANEDRTREITKNYPAMRQITGEYLVREITIK
jgi:ABC-type branched-subunit amino acid transport system substrate-binding protein